MELYAYVRDFINDHDHIKMAPSNAPKVVSEVLHDQMMQQYINEAIEQFDKQHPEVPQKQTLEHSDIFVELSDDTNLEDLEATINKFVYKEAVDASGLFAFMSDTFGLVQRDDHQWISINGTYRFALPAKHAIPFNLIKQSALDAADHNYFRKRDDFE